MCLIERARRFLTGLKKTKGFTLPEVAAVVAITGALAAVIVPVAIDQIELSRMAKAKMDVDGIHAAVSLFHKDTAAWPVRTSLTNPKGVDVLRSGSWNANFELFGSPSTGNVKDPDGRFVSTWTGLAAPMVNHLTIDNPGGDSSTPNGYYILADVNWAGPYMAQTFSDPWGRNYLISAKAFTERSSGEGDDTTFYYVWIISAGPNETLETEITSPILNNAAVDPDTSGLTSTADDIGMMMFQRRASIGGISQ